MPDQVVDAMLNVIRTGDLVGRGPEWATVDLLLLTEGSSNRAIAKTLFISEKTVSVHVSNLMAKLGVSSRLEAAALAHQLASAVDR